MKSDYNHLLKWPYMDHLFSTYIHAHMYIHTCKKQRAHTHTHTHTHTESLTLRYMASAASLNAATTLAFFSLNFSNIAANIYTIQLQVNMHVHMHSNIDTVLTTEAYG